MPTPESEAFLAKKPTVPPTFEGVDMLDNKAVYDARDAIIREQWVQQMMARLVREELGKCYVREGVNHLQNCGKYRGNNSPYFFYILLQRSIFPGSPKTPPHKKKQIATSSS
ncbi:hypothetical protein GJ744_008525 [Endocarpon pusillum]|uniref:NADH-ubiquinone oxidoreductase 12 kDa subunit n=1 Tax=Endocarpon pusillum TaxID=364733 RepID=A0A8H7AKA8_9EURO|nr:hypothetical protein GJ744_008525 [Endocarpon pusillum]